MKKRLLSLALCGALLCGALAGCGGNETPSTSQESSPSQTAEEPKILTTAVSAELNTLYPLNMDVQNNIGTKLCYEGLVNYENGEIVPCLAESWEFSDDGKALTFHLKEGVTSTMERRSMRRRSRQTLSLHIPIPISAISPPRPSWRALRSWTSTR